MSMAFDIGEMLFREVLGFSSYPGSPFTGNLFQDIIMFFFIPTVFLIIFIYVTAGIIVAPENKKLNLLMGLSIYAFIVAGHYFEAVAIFASQFYFLFILLIGLIYFLGRHFRRPGGARMAYEGGGARMAYENSGGSHSGHNVLNPVDRARARKRLEEVNRLIRDLEGRLAHAQNTGSRDAEVWAQQLASLLQEKNALEHELEISPLK